MSLEQTKLNSLTLDLLLQILPFGSLYISTCVRVLDEAGVCFGEFGEYIVDFCNDCDIQLPDLDICAQAFEYILQEARREIKEQTKVDILNDLEHEVYVYGNYCCSSYDSKNFKLTRKVIERIPVVERSKLLCWFLDHLE
jgi:hypothetical protein